MQPQEAPGRSQAPDRKIGVTIRVNFMIKARKERQAASRYARSRLPFFPGITRAYSASYKELHIRPEDCLSRSMWSDIVPREFAL